MLTYNALLAPPLPPLPASYTTRAGLGAPITAAPQPLSHRLLHAKRQAKVERPWQVKKVVAAKGACCTNNRSCKAVGQDGPPLRNSLSAHSHEAAPSAPAPGSICTLKCSLNEAWSPGSETPPVHLQLLLSSRPSGAGACTARGAVPSSSCSP